MREIILDTETTGLSPAQGHRIVEIGCVEMINRRVTARTFHTYIYPERDIPAEATAISGITNEHLRDKPLFAHIVEDFLEFIDGGTLVIHNAPFDVGFLNSELGRVDKPLINLAHAIDTVKMARRQFPGSPANLDALCRRFKVDNSKREKHGALLDAHLLARVYVHLTGGPQRKLFSDQGTGTADGSKTQEIRADHGMPVRPARDFPATADELAVHKEFLGQITDPLWDKMN